MENKMNEMNKVKKVKKTKKNGKSPWEKKSLESFEKKVNF